MQILMVFSEFNINIISITTNSDKKMSHFLSIDIVAEILIPSKVYYLLKELKNKEKLIKIKQIKIE